MNEIMILMYAYSKKFAIIILFSEVGKLCMIVLVGDQRLLATGSFSGSPSLPNTELIFSSFTQVPLTSLVLL